MAADTAYSATEPQRATRLGSDAARVETRRKVARPAGLGGPPRARADLAWRWIAVSVASLIALPMLSVAVSLLSDAGETWAHLWATTMPDILVNTAILMAGVAIGTIVIGVSTAWLVTMCRFPGSRMFEVALLLPLAMPAFIIGYAYTDFLTYAGPVQTLLRETFGWTRRDYWFPDIHSVGGVAALMTLVLYPYVYLLTRAAFLDQSAGVLEASRVLGRGPWATFWRVALPMARPAIGAGVALALMETLADFGTVQYFGIATFTTAIYRTWFGMGEPVAAAQLSTALLSVALTLIVLERVSRGARRYQETTKKAIAPAATRLGGVAAFAAFLACAVPVVLGFVLPVVIFISLAFEVSDGLLLTNLFSYATNSLILAGLAALVVSATAILLVYAVRIDRSPITRSALRLSATGYAIPGSVIAVGVLVPLGWFDGAVSSTIGALTGAAPMLILSGTAVALLYAYLVRFLAVAVGPIESGMGKISPSIDGTARSLGAGPLKIVWRLHAPMLATSVLTGALIVFVDVFKELPATMIVRPFNFETLAVRVYTLASDERLAQASTGALMIVAVGLLPVMLLSWSIRRAKRPRPRHRALMPARGVDA